MSKIGYAKAPIRVLPGPKGIPGFVKWAKATYPSIYREVGARLTQNVQRGMQGMGWVDLTKAADPVAVAATKPGIASTILDTFKELVTVGLPLYQQNKIFDLQLKRAQAGQSMIDTSQLQDASALRVGVDSATRNTGMVIAGVAVLGLLGFALLRRK